MFINLTKIGLNLVKVVEVKVSKIILIVIRHRSEEADIQFILVMQQ